MTPYFWHCVRRVLGLLLILLALVCLVEQLWGCGGETAEAKYGAALLRCVDKAETLAESKACRRLVDEAWNVDAGGR